MIGEILFNAYADDGRGHFDPFSFDASVSAEEEAQIRAGVAHIPALFGRVASSHNTWCVWRYESGDFTLKRLTWDDGLYCPTAIDVILKLRAYYEHAPDEVSRPDEECRCERPL